MALTKEQVTKLKAVKQGEKAKCPLCGIGHYGGIFMASCDNRACPAYNSFNMGRCGICRQERRWCSC